MKKIIIYSAVFIALALFTACAPVQIYSDAGMTKKSGLKVYTVKPYFRVERDTGSGAIVKAEVLYLPDLANPLYIGLKNGPGSRKIDLKLTDGCISSFGYSSDTKIDDYVDALSALLSKGTYAVTNLKAMGVESGAANNVVEIYEVVIQNGRTVLRRVEAAESE